ncbi:hypothetical protein AAFP30_13105 [Gordonia sp. CPCC 205515]|uniref:hypothetical protein n=1 Tax=Gordonia sp. CPCC 205515 TaxID=3140791 RepID=UPI003AF3C52E
MKHTIASPPQLAVAAIPVIAFLAMPFLPFVNTDALWFGVPSVLVWSFGAVLLTVASLNVVDYIGRRDRLSDAGTEGTEVTR